MWHLLPNYDRQELVTMPLLCYWRQTDRQMGRQIDCNITHVNRIGDVKYRSFFITKEAMGGALCRRGGWWTWVDVLQGPVTVCSNLCIASQTFTVSVHLLPVFTIRPRSHGLPARFHCFLLVPCLPSMWLNLGFLMSAPLSPECALFIHLSLIKDSSLFLSSF